MSFRRPPKTRSRPQLEKGFNAPQRVMRISQCVRRLVLGEFFQDPASRHLIRNAGENTDPCETRVPPTEDSSEADLVTATEGRQR